MIGGLMGGTILCIFIKLLMAGADGGSTVDSRDQCVTDTCGAAVADVNW